MHKNCTRWSSPLVHKLADFKDTSSGAHKPNPVPRKPPGFSHNQNVASKLPDFNHHSYEIHLVNSSVVLSPPPPASPLCDDRRHKKIKQVRSGQVRSKWSPRREVEGPEGAKVLPPVVGHVKKNKHSCCGDCEMKSSDPECCFFQPV